MITITLSNQKGGVAKTTTVLAICTALHEQGKKVLAVDLDPQTNLSFACGIEPLKTATIYDVFHNTHKMSDILTNSNEGFLIAPGCLDLASADMDYTQTGRKHMLKEALKEVEKDFDYCIIDTPPTLGILTINALVASDFVIIPMCADIYSVQGLAQLNQLINKVRKSCNPGLKIGGILMTKYNDRQNISRATKEMIDNASESIGTGVFETTIRESVAVRESALLQSNMFKEAPNSNATTDYKAFVEEMKQKGII